jgi:hypothetical protein
MTRNEGRTVLNMPKSEATGMDDFYFRSNNLSPVGTEPDDTPPGDPNADPAAVGG